MGDFKLRIVNKLIAILSCYKDNMERNDYIKSIRTSYQKLTNKTELSSEQEEEIQTYYTRLLGHSVPLDWHRYFSARTGVYSKFYIPTSEYKTNIVGRLNIYPLKRAYTDKNITDIFLQETHQPKIYIKNMNGYYYADNRPISKEKALELCKNLGEVMIKPSLTGRGEGVKKIRISNGVVKTEGKTIEQLFDDYRSDFLIESVICQHEQMKALNPTSVNSIRIVTFRSGMDIFVIYTVIRIGRKDQVVDNESSGGISAIIREDGTLGKYAYGAPGYDKIEYTDSGIKLEGYQIPSYQSVINVAKASHYHLPYFDLVGWDFAIEEDGSPVLIEFNMTPDLSQSANGPAFGRYTEAIIEEAMKKSNTWSRITQERMWRKNVIKK